MQPQNLTNGQTSAEDMQNKKKGLRASQSFDEAVLGGQDEQPQVWTYTYMNIITVVKLHSEAAKIQ